MLQRKTDNVAIAGSCSTVAAVAAAAAAAARDSSRLVGRGMVAAVEDGFSRCVPRGVFGVV